MRASPLSTTAVTPGTVTLVSATLVERMILRCEAGASARSCSSAGRSPCRGSTSRRRCAASSATASPAWRISAAPGRNTRTSPLVSATVSLRTAAATCSERRCGSGRSACSTATSKRRPSLRTMAHPRCAATGPASSVADMTSTLRSGRGPRKSCSKSASATSPCRCRSWNSSSTTAETPRRSGSASSRRVSTPSVTYRSRVRGPVASSNRTWYPTVSPGRSPSSCATRRAAVRAASRRGSSTTTSPGTRSSRAGGTRVVLPAPAGASSTSAGPARIRAATSGSTSSMGSGSRIAVEDSHGRHQELAEVYLRIDRLQSTRAKAANAIAPASAPSAVPARSRPSSARAG